MMILLIVPLIVCVMVCVIVCVIVCVVLLPALSDARSESECGGSGDCSCMQTVDPPLSARSSRALQSNAYKTRAQNSDGASGGAVCGSPSANL